jgi:hypothetical protein
MVMRRQGPPSKRRARRREDERDKLEARWKKNRERRKAGWPVSSTEVEPAVSRTNTFDADGNQVIIERRGAEALTEHQAINNHSAELCAKVQNWNRKRGKDGKVGDVKDISGEDVIDILEIAGALTNHPAYAAARKALILHRLHRGGLRRAFHKLLHRHGHDQVPDLNDTVQWYMDEFDYNSRRAIEHVVANMGVSGTSFANAVDKTRKAYAKRERHEVERQKYHEELSGRRDPDDSR